ncbi:malic oxidoreductase [Lucifera butyrica]|uniref:Malic oxidoreductase n=1 Tax=Lucifera butyrica TaxID=1351585 RepID=A0A498RBK6_9FIRM|nr:NADP-dependent malic enzyme [Lucifera butyrica]VBB07652.1 malic oxidoreductase [Lucifera butyrica]
MNVYEKSLALHEQAKGKLAVIGKVPFAGQDDLSLVYSPGVAEPCRRIAANPDNAYRYTAKGNLIAVVSDGSAVLGLGNIGPKAAIPVMEGKALLFKSLAGIDAIPLCLDTQSTEELIKTIKYLSPCFGGINLEDIAAPRCFEIETRLKKELDIPVFHDDQHGTAVCVLAGLINAHKVVGKNLTESNIVINGAGAAGIAIARLLAAFGAKKILMVDKKGIVNRQNPATILHDGHAAAAEFTNPEERDGTLAEAMTGADVFVGVSAPGILTRDMVRTMNEKAIVFALANPTPEIFPDEALAGGAAVVGTGRSDFPNMINNVLAFPGIMKGAMSVRAADINERMCMAAAMALAGCVPAIQLDANHIFPAPLDTNVPAAVAAAVAVAAKDSGLARQ